jgi:hypothetical protein
MEGDQDWQRSVGRVRLAVSLHLLVDAPTFFALDPATHTGMNAAWSQREVEEA